MDAKAGLPNAHAAHVPPGKVSEYLLSLAHSYGASKARFFRRLGYGDETAKLLESELLQLARDGELAGTIPGTYGTKYIVEGKIRRPGGGQASLTSVWLIEQGKTRPRLVTAYQRRQRQGSDDT
ncbi:MAG: hypothetical protein JSV86_03980 [Gemmatimonadota bacterium]|nr:MAG: hypothetical protein JSV86_03980 [Gemmatimonadota bacterium]